MGSLFRWGVRVFLFNLGIILFANIPLYAQADDPVRTIKDNKEYAYMPLMDSLLRNYQKPPLEVKDTPQKKQNQTTFFDNKSVVLFFKFLAVAFILFIVYRLLKKNIFGSGNTKIIKQIQQDLNAGEELTEVDHYNELIQKAELLPDENLAVKYQYLKTLKLLSDKGLIQFAPEKTNTEYVREMSTHPMRNGFEDITRKYEYVWYGRNKINEESYQNIRNRFQQFFNGI